MEDQVDVVLAGCGEQQLEVTGWSEKMETSQGFTTGSDPNQVGSQPSRTGARVPVAVAGVVA